MEKNGLIAAIYQLKRNFWIAAQLRMIVKIQFRLNECFANERKSSNPLQGILILICQSRALSPEHHPAMVRTTS